ncbi:LrgB-like family-domain-containing protein, partial [Myxozyma melibiosi]
RLFHSFVLVPIGVVVVLLYLYGVHRVIILTTVNFPASVVCMLLLFLLLLLIDSTLGPRRTAIFSRIIDVPLGFALRWINTFFTPSFVTLPLSPAVGGAEVGKIAAVFILGFVVTMAITAYMVVFLQRLFGTSKRAITERAEEVPPHSAHDNSLDLTQSIELDVLEPATTTTTHLPPSPIDITPTQIAPPQPAASASHSSPRRAREVPFPTASIANQTSESDTASTVGSTQQQQVAAFFSIGEPSPRAQFFANWITQYLDTFLYITVFLCVGLPLHFAINYSLIAYSTFTILMLFFGLRLPPKVRRFIHPIFTCSAFTIFGIYVMATANHQTLDDGLDQYSTGRTYLYLFGVPKYYGVRPGAGDLMKTMLDVSIVSLALPMYRYRGDLKKHFLVIIIPNIVIGLITFFAYPPLCYAIGISAERSIAFIGRSVTLALALPVIQALGGSQSLVAVVAILSGIVGVLIGGYILKLLRIREDDYLTRGITLGINSSAVATAHLLTIDPRASALSSLSFVVFGTTMIILSAIPPIVTVMKNMVGL